VLDDKEDALEKMWESVLPEGTIKAINGSVKPEFIVGNVY